MKLLLKTGYKQTPPTTYIVVAGQGDFLMSSAICLTALVVPSVRVR